jgi:hypothetical protein
MKSGKKKYRRMWRKGNHENKGKVKRAKMQKE